MFWVSRPQLLARLKWEKSESLKGVLQGEITKQLKFVMGKARYFSIHDGISHEIF